MKVWFIDLLTCRIVSIYDWESVVEVSVPCRVVKLNTKNTNLNKIVSDSKSIHQTIIYMTIQFYHMYVLRRRCEIVHFVKWTTQLSIS